MPENIANNSLQVNNPALAAEWHPTLNLDLTPSMVSCSSRKKVWWLGKCGHEWDAFIYSRNNGRGCPICAGYRVLAGFNDLAYKAPDLIKEWDYDKNTIKPTEVISGSHKYAWWICSSCGHSWQAEIRGRVKGNGCPICMRKKLSIAVHKGRLRNATSLADTHNPILSEWDYEKNTDINPSTVTFQSHMKAWWICKDCGYSWNASIKNRMNGSGCPACAGSIVVYGKNDLLSNNPELCKEWNYPKNTHSPKEFFKSSASNVWWICNYGHEWQATIHDRVTKHVGCPICSKHYKSSLSEHCLYYYIKKHFPDAINSYKSKFLGRRELDIFIPSLQTGIEYDGSNYHKDVNKDIIKDKLCTENGIKLIRVRETKCPTIVRTDLSICLKDDSSLELSKAIANILSSLGIQEEINIDRDYNSIIASFHDTAVKGSLRELYPSLAEEWAEDNYPIKPENVIATKGKSKFYWKCKKCSNVWKTTVLERLNGTGCPVCANKKVLAGTNDLATSHPDLLSEWNYEKNTDLSPQSITYGNQTNVWWICSKCGYEWNTRINRRVNGSGCPQCARNKRKKKVSQYDIAGNLLAIYDSLDEAESQTGVSKSCISMACNDKRNNHDHIGKGFIWKYTDST